MGDCATDWTAAAAVAERLGLHTRGLVASRDTEAARSWALRMWRECDAGAYNVPRAASYLELAVLLGHVEPERQPDEVSDAA